MDLFKRLEKEEGRRKKEEGRRKKEEGRRKKEEGRRKKDEGNILFISDSRPLTLSPSRPLSCSVTSSFGNGRGDRTMEMWLRAND
jgi:hypothetical protein